MEKLYIRTIETLVIAGLIVMVALTFISTTIRLIPGYGGIFWAEEVTRYVSIWVVFLAAGLGVRYGIHLNLGLLVDTFPKTVRKLFHLFSFVIMLLFEGVLIWYGTELAIYNYDQQSASLQIPMAYAYAAIPVGATIMFFETVRLLVRELAGEQTTETAEES